MADKAEGVSQGDADSSRGGEERKAILLRLPPRLHAELRSWAAAELRSLNAHLEYLLADAARKRRRETKK